MKKSRNYLLIILINIILITHMTIKDGYPSVNRSTKLSTPFPKIEITGTQKVEVKIKITNEGEIDEIFDLSIKGPETWEPIIKSENYIIKSIYLEKNESKELDFQATPPPNEQSGSYTFELLATSEDKLLEVSSKIHIELIGITAPSEILMSTTFPSLEGTSTQQYEFRVTMRNSGSENRIVGFSALHPNEWRMIYNPIYEDRIINSLEFKAGESRDIMVTVIPSPDAEPGNYNITLFGTSGDLQGQINFNINLIGTHELYVTTSDGLLSFDSLQGKNSQIIITLENIGTAPLENVHFISSKPPGWEVNFEPNSIPIINPNTIYEVRANIIPPSDAIPGDYVLTLTSKVDPWISEPLHFRTTVRGSVSWGFVGLAIIIVIAISIIVIFRRVGRR